MVGWEMETYAALAAVGAAMLTGKTREDVETLLAETYDYVVVGGGAAGCVVARRLAESGVFSVLLVEAGGEEASKDVSVPARWLSLHENERHRWTHDWNLWSSVQPGTGKRAWPRGETWALPQGRGLGGSSSIGAMLYVRGNPTDYDEWAELTGDDTWSYRAMLPYFCVSENNANGASKYHGTGGPMHVGDLPHETPLRKDFLAAAEKVGLAPNPDFNGPVQEGAGAYQATISNGVRVNTGRAFLRPLRSRKNLAVVTQAQVNKVIFQTLEDGTKRAKGVTFDDPHGRTFWVRASREVVLCAGALGTPKLLLLSGIGPAAHLREHGIPVVADVPGVGSNLQVHVNVPHVFESRVPRPPAPVALARAYLEYYTFAGGLLSHNGIEAGAFLRTHHTHRRPDVQIHLCLSGPDEGVDTRYGIDPKDVPMHWKGKPWADLKQKDPSNFFTMVHALLRLASRGTVRLRSKNARDPAVIDPKFLQDDADMDPLIESFRTMRDLAGLMDLAGQEVQPGPQVTDPADLRAYARQFGSCYHFAGTAKMGKADDPLAVVDTKMRVRGVEGLRVVDASVMPTIVSGNLLAPTVAIAEKASHDMMYTLLAKL